MTRREFLKNISRLTAGLIMLQMGKFFSFFQNQPPHASRRQHRAKFYRQADHLAG